MTVFTMVIQKNLLSVIDYQIHVVDYQIRADYQVHVHLQETLIKAFTEQDWENDLHIVIQNCGANEFDVPLLKTQLLLLPEIAKFYGLGSRM